MAGYVILGALAAFGLLCSLWALFGALLPGMDGWTMVFCGEAEEENFWRLRWLKSLGLLKCPALLVTEKKDGPDIPEIEICGREELLPRLEQERNLTNGTGNGDHTGRHQRRGVSEL